MIICHYCKKEIKEKNYPILQVVLGDVNNPVAADPPQPYHIKCVDNLALTESERQAVGIRKAISSNEKPSERQPRIKEDG